nr:PREDICTED: uncharacterized protein LOC109435373 [Rhinolophus sinicus]
MREQSCATGSELAFVRAGPGQGQQRHPDAGWLPAPGRCGPPTPLPSPAQEYHCVVQNCCGLLVSGGPGSSWQVCPASTDTRSPWGRPLPVPDLGGAGAVHFLGAQRHSPEHCQLPVTLLPGGILLITSVSPADMGTYCCRARNVANTRHSQDARLTLSEPAGPGLQEAVGRGTFEHVFSSLEPDTASSIQLRACSARARPSTPPPRAAASQPLWPCRAPGFRQTGCQPAHPISSTAPAALGFSTTVLNATSVQASWQPPPQPGPIQGFKLFHRNCRLPTLRGPCSCLAMSAPSSTHIWSQPPSTRSSCKHSMAVAMVTAVHALSLCVMCPWSPLMRRLRPRGGSSPQSCGTRTRRPGGQRTASSADRGPGSASGCLGQSCGLSRPGCEHREAGGEDRTHHPGDRGAATLGLGPSKLASSQVPLSLAPPKYLPHLSLPPQSQ